MRLLSVKTYTLEEYFEPNIPPYAILSHRWEQEEVLYTDIGTVPCTTKQGWAKVQRACDQALQEGLEYVWIDTCCIDKTSSAELSEAINSMFRWYRDSRICYAYLSDVTSSDCTVVFTKCIVAWFDRGWTLQELIAPQRVVFYNRVWTRLGDRNELSPQLSRKTHIPERMLSTVNNVEKTLLTFSAAQKMSWAAGRKTTRIEDRSYSLLCLFGVSMPLLYGEGSQAFARLQEEILRTGTDLSILAWLQESSQGRHTLNYLLAESPDNFEGCEDIVDAFPNPYLPSEDTDFNMTKKGLQIDHPPIVTLPTRNSGSRFALGLGCRRINDPQGVFALKIQLPASNTLVDPLQSSKRRICHLGWSSDVPGHDARVTRAEFFEPVLLHDWQAITISRQHVDRALRRALAIEAPHRHLWFLLPIADRTSWHVLVTWPRGLRSPWYQQACHLGEVTDLSFKFASLAIGSESGESFAVNLWYNCNTINFSLSECDRDLKLFPQSGSRHETVEDRLRLSCWCRIRIVLQNVRRSGHIINQLKLEVERSPSLVHDPPYEVEGDYSFNADPEPEPELPSIPPTPRLRAVS